MRRRLLSIAGFSAMGLSGLIVLAVAGVEGGPVPFAVALALAVTPVPLYLWLLLRLDRLEPEPRRTLIVVFLWGACVATLIALILNTAGELIVGHTLGREAGEIYGGSISAPVVEESAKGAVLFWLYRRRRAEFDGILDGIVYAGCVALGFAMVENVLYYTQGAVQDGLPGALTTFVVRGLFSPFAHPVFTAATGVGLGIAARSARRPVQIAAPLLGLGTAMGLHSTWNTAAGSGHVVGVYVLVMAPVFVVFVVLAVAQRRRERRIVLRWLPEEVQRGTLRPADVEALASLRVRRQAQRQARARGGRPARRALRDVQLAATELAFLAEREDRGLLEGDTDATRRESYWRERLRVRTADLQAALTT